jgi:nicotinamidase-related amidase
VPVTLTLSAHARTVRSITAVISRFGDDSALVLVDVQVGVDDLAHWGGPTGRRNNPGAEEHQLELLSAWRSAGLPVVWSLHDSREPDSPLRRDVPGGALKPGFEPAADDVVVTKDVNSVFVGTALEVLLRRAGVRRLVVTGFFTNMCVETSTRMAGNLGFDTYLVPEACATTNRVGPDGTDHDPEVVHALSVASLHGEFCTTLAVPEVRALLRADAAALQRVQGNEPTRRARVPRPAGPAADEVRVTS